MRNSNPEAMAVIFAFLFACLAWYLFLSIFAL